MLDWQLFDFLGRPGLVLLKNLYFCDFFRGGGGSGLPVPPSGSAHVDDQFISENSKYSGAIPHFVACCLPKGLPFTKG